MPETVLVTICCGDRRGDFELPARLPLESWQGALMEATRDAFRLRLEKGRKIRLMKDQLELRPGWTLEQCGIYDGSILHLTIE